MPRAELSWGALHYEEAGSGPPLLLISGLNGLAQPWRGIMPALGQRFRVIAHDHRGLGASDKWDGVYSVDQIAGDVLGLMDRLGIEKAHVVGHSLGGATAQALAADHPDRVGGVVIYASWAGPDPYFARVMTMRREMLLAMGVEEFIRTGPIGIYPPRWIVEQTKAFEAALPASVAAFPGVEVMVRRMQACLDHDRRASLGRIKTPTLVLGMLDDMSTPAFCSEELASAITGAELALLPFGGHNAHLVIPDQITELFMGFFTSPAIAGLIAPA